MLSDHAARSSLAFLACYQACTASKTRVPGRGSACGPLVVAAASAASAARQVRRPRRRQAPAGNHPAPTLLARWNLCGGSCPPAYPAAGLLWGSEASTACRAVLRRRPPHIHRYFSRPGYRRRQSAISMTTSVWPPRCRVMRLNAAPSAACPVPARVQRAARACRTDARWSRGRLLVAAAAEAPPPEEPSPVPPSLPSSPPTSSDTGACSPPEAASRAYSSMCDKLAKAQQVRCALRWD